MEVKQFKEGEEGPKGITGQVGGSETGLTGIQGHMLIVSTAVERFCPKCGNYYRDNTIIMCPHCSMSLNFTEYYNVERKCDACDFTVKAPPSYFEENPSNYICPHCEEGKLVKVEIFQEAPSFSIDGKFNGANRSKIIREKNEQLKKKNAGYSYENPESIKDKTHRKFEERKKNE